MPKCKICNVKFTPKYFNQKYCMDEIECIKAFNESVKELRSKQIQKAKVKEKKELKEKVMTLSEWLNIFQKVFNTYIRLRDKHLPCITCNILKNNVQYHAGHFYSVGSNPSLRFNEDNVHKQCSSCNCKKHGNISEYAINLPKRIGVKRFEILTSNRTNVLRLTIPEIQDLIKTYKAKIKELEK
jgi:hypothetical protein